MNTWINSVAKSDRYRYFK